MIRDERHEDVAAIGDLTAAAFLGKAHAGGNEAEIVERLRQSGALILSLVDEKGSDMRGHIAASPATVGGIEGWAAIGPVSVRPEVQGYGIGSALMQAALERLRTHGMTGVVLAGDPKFYARFGFATDPGLRSRGIPPEYLMALRFDPGPISGEIAFDEAFRPQ